MFTGLGFRAQGWVSAKELKILGRMLLKGPEG